MNCRIIRSNRRSLGLEVNTEGLIVRAPIIATDAEINSFVSEHKAWIEKSLKKVAEKQKTLENLEPLTMEDT